MAKNQTSVTFTDSQRQAIEAAFQDLPESERPEFAEMIRSLVAGGLALYQIEWPPDPTRGGRRDGSGRKRKAE